MGGMAQEQSERKHALAFHEEYQVDLDQEEIMASLEKRKTPLFKGHNSTLSVYVDNLGDWLSRYTSST